MSLATESTPLLPSFHSTHQKNKAACPTLAVFRALIALLFWPVASLARLFYRNSSQTILPTTAVSPPPAPNLTSHGTSLDKSEKTTTQMILPQESALVVVMRSELPTSTYPMSSLKKTPSYDSILPMKENRSVRFSAIIDIHEFSRLAGEPFGMVQPTKAPGVKIPQVRMEGELRYNSEQARLTLELEPPPLKSTYNPRLVDDDDDYYSSRSRYD
ncbi:hypothetical protein FRC08_003400 [Ceratobasidium sp. 394]|nr:hypothetical protein FRC08_003400 [Ceratobasidium sp. 394]KAG9092141.1 hypothetical protein FS749_015965 [Ceratobasidium sp. UAMH 11750]